MRYTAVLPYVAAATAFVIPDDVTLQQLTLNPKEDVSHKASSAASWWDRIPSLDDLRTSIEDTFSNTVDAFDSTTKSFFESLPTVEIESELEDFLPSWGRPGRGRGGHHGKPGHHGPSNLTIYEAIQASNYTKKFAKLIDEYPDIVKALNSTKHNLTLFVPIDRAFDKIPEHHKKPPKEFIEKVLNYHVASGLFPAGRILASHTLPTLVKEKALGGKPQRLSASFGLHGLRINFYSKVVGANLFTANGVIHAVDSILVPPPSVPRIISFFPSTFSTLILAAEKTSLGKEVHGVETTGATIFTPTNVAFQKLGPRANAFLFNTEKGLGFLKALLKYHIVLNETLYSDAYYGKDTDEADAKITARYHVDLPTLLDGKSIAVDISRWGGWIDFKVNGYIHVAAQDVVAKDGVIQVVNNVLIPPHKHKGDHSEDAEIEVEDLIERLQPYMEESKDYSPGEL